MYGRTERVKGEFRGVMEGTTVGNSQHPRGWGGKGRGGNCEHYASLEEPLGGPARACSVGARTSEAVS